MTSLQLTNMMKSFKSLLSQLRGEPSYSTRSPQDNFFKYSESGIDYQMFAHNFNCGYPGIPRTERCVELALADYWLTRTHNVCEIGAVTPYYWPGRIPQIIDPIDNHEKVTHRGSLFDYSFKNMNILSISTIEHVGMSDYGLKEDNSSMHALIKITSECNTCLLTVPIGWNQQLDEFLLDTSRQFSFKVTFLKRNYQHKWILVRASEAAAKYGPPLSNWANSIAIIEIGSTLS